MMVSRGALRLLFNQGRFKPQPTLAFTTFVYHPVGVELVLSDMYQREVGGCWYDDVRNVLQEAEDEGERARINPNLPVFQAVVRQVGQQEDRVKAALAAEHAYKAREVISLYPNPNTLR